MNTKSLTDRILRRELILAVTLLGGLLLTLGLLWLVGGAATPAAAAPALDKVPSPSNKPDAKPLHAPLQASAWTTATPITVYNSGPAVLTDFQISLTIPYAGGMQTDFDDLRFGDADGNCLSYWVESITGTAPSATATVWVKVPSIPTPTTTISMYYGNPSISTASNGEDAFEFFDDFEGTSLDTNKWTAYSNDYEVSSSILKINTGGIERTGPFPFKIQDGYMSETRARHEVSSGGYGGVLPEVASSSYTASSNGNSDATVLYMRQSSSKNVYQWIGDGSTNSYNVGSGDTGWVTANSTWYVTGISVNGGTVKLWRDGVVVENTSGISWDKDIRYVKLGSFHRSNNYNLQETSYDWVRFRKYVTPTVAPTSTLRSPTQVPDLVVVKSVRSTTLTPTLVNAGDPITYTIAFSNAGDVAATNVVITDIVPVSVTSPAQSWSCSGSAGIGTLSDIFIWDVTDLAVNEFCMITITGQLSDPLTLPGGHVFTNTVVGAAAGDCPCNSSDAVAVTVNHYPTATASASPKDINLCGNSALDGTSSSDVEDPTSLSYHWTQTGGPAIEGIDNPFSATSSFTGSCTQEGVVTITLTVTDTGGLTNTADVTVTVKNVPVDGLSVINNSTTTLGCTTYFTAEITDGSSVTYTWNFGDGYITETDDIAHVSYIDRIYDPTCVTESITYTVRITASNRPTDTTYTDTATTIVTITNQAPVAVAGVAPPVDRYQQAVIDSLVTLDGSNSHDDDYPCHNIDEYYWEQTGGFTATLSDPTVVSPTFTAPSPPTLPTVITFTLTVTDSGCLTAMDTISITLVPPVGGHTEPVEKAALIWPWAALVAVLGAAVIVTVAALKRRGVSAL